MYTCSACTVHRQCRHALQSVAYGGFECVFVGFARWCGWIRVVPKNEFLSVCFCVKKWPCYTDSRLRSNFMLTLSTTDDDDDVISLTLPACVGALGLSLW